MARKCVANEAGCWEWQGYIDRDGYAVSDQRTQYGTTRAHRVLYMMLIGPIPEGLQLDHTCKNRRCVNPLHMEPVTNKENARRGRNMGRRVTHCVNGHEFNAENTLVIHRRSGQERVCRACMRDRARLDRVRNPERAHARDKAAKQAKRAKRQREPTPQ